jgi:hypothetical protein
MITLLAASAALKSGNWQQPEAAHRAARFRRQLSGAGCSAQQSAYCLARERRTPRYNSPVIGSQDRSLNSRRCQFPLAGSRV